MPKLRRPELSLREHLSAKVPAGTLDRIDRIGNGDRSTGARAVIVAGLEALEGRSLPSREATPPPPPPPAALDVAALADAVIDRLPSQRVVRIGPPSADTIAAGIVLALRDPATRVAIVAELAAVVDGLRRPPLSPPPAPPADGPRIDPATLRGVGGERRQNPPERRDPAPREDAPGRRLADALRAARDARGLTQRDAAAAARVSGSTYQRAERGDDVNESTRAALTAWIGEG